MKKNATFLLLALCFLISSNLFSQNHYEKGWEYLNNADVQNAVSSFEKALKDKNTKEKSQLTLCLLYTALGKPESASVLFNDFYATSKDPGSELFALWLDEGVIGFSKKYKPFQLDLIKKIESDTRLKGRFEEIVKYRFLTNYLFSNNSDKYLEYAQKINAIRNWSFVGPFDNVMNSGFNKDFGVVQNPKQEKTFQSRYGAEIQWFTPREGTLDGYVIKNNYIYSTNSITYAQSFVESSVEQDVLMKFGYSGSLKVWLNDSLAFSEPERRQTELDYFQIKCHLNKGYNRVLVQLGEYEESYPNFIMRFTDLQQNGLSLPSKSDYQAYQKYIGSFTKIPFFAIEHLLKKSENDILYQLLLAKTYHRSFDLYAEEEVLTSLYTRYPKNYLVLRQLITFYRDSENTTLQNETYETFKGLYPEDFDILANGIKEATDQKDKTKLKELEALFKSKYPYANMKTDMIDVINYGLDEKVDKMATKLEEISKKNPDEHEIILINYNFQKSLNPDPAKTNQILENYLKNNNNYQIRNKLKDSYVEQGRIEDAIKLMEENQKFSKDPILDRAIIYLFYRKKAYEEAINIGRKTLENNPSHYEVIGDLAILYNTINNKKMAIDSYEEALRYFPFSFDYNEKIRELKGQKPTFDLVKGLDPSEVIKAYEKEFVNKSKHTHDIVADKKSTIIFKTKAVGFRISYIVRINQESAIEEWQKIDLSQGSNMAAQILETKTIKKNGNKIDAERNGDEAVFTNLEVGDYIYVDYISKQQNGSKSSLFFSDDFEVNSYNPVYKREYTVYAEEGVIIKDSVINSKLKPKISKTEGFNVYNWAVTSPELVKTEPVQLPFSDIGTMIHIGLEYTWNDIAQWYSDLSEKQAQSDFTIQSIVKNLFSDKKYTDEQKAKIIYDFICKNIQYSSIDFRQGSYIPQKASTVYHTRLGDCKDVSTLYASIARAAGLDVNLVLVNTRDNGQKNIILPSLNFNHCIVKVNLKSGSKYLELTDTDLPYGHLYYTHNEAAILEIPNGNIPKNLSLTYLNLNQGFTNRVIRTGNVYLNNTTNITLEKRAIKVGNQASGFCKSYYYSDEEQRKEDFKKSLLDDFTSNVKLSSLVFEKLEPRADTAVYNYNFTVENELKKIGSFKSLKIPFSDIVAKLNIFEDNERTTDFDYSYYEQVDYFEESLIINLDGSIKLLEVPENVHLTFKNNIYDLSFTKIDDQHLKIKRSYQAERKNINAKDFAEFKTFITKAIEADNTSLVFK